MATVRKINIKFGIKNILIFLSMVLILSVVRYYLCSMEQRFRNLSQTYSYIPIIEQILFILSY